MKLTDDDFTSHACDDPSKENDGLGWNLDTDMTTEGKNELIENQKLRESVEEKSKKRSNGCNSYDPDCPICDEIYVCRQLLKEIKN